MEAKHALLLVDDEENILNSLRRLFRREPFEVLTAASGMEGLDLLRAHSVSVIVSDQRMPEMVGAEFLRRSIEVAPRAVRIMLTGYADVEATVQAINKGQIYRYVTKPWNDGEMKMVVRAAAQRFDLLESNRLLTAELKETNAQLETLNSELEQRVEARTRELRSAYEENLRLTEALGLKVKELEGRDRITQYLLAVHGLEETLELVLEVISDTLEMDQAVVYLRDREGFRAAAAIGVGEAGRVLTREELGGIEPTPTHQRAFAESAERVEPVNVTDPQEPSVAPFAVVPVSRDGEVLGLIAVDRHRRAVALEDGEVRAVASFALQVAIALHDAQIQGDYNRWKGRLDDVLKGVEETDPLEDV